MVGSYLIDDCSLYIKEARNYKNAVVYRVCYMSSDGLDCGYIKEYKYYKAAENFIKKLRK